METVTEGNAFSVCSKAEMLEAFDQIHEREDYSFANLIQRLSRYNLDEYVEEILYNVFQPGLPQFKGIQGWTVSMVKEWAKKISFLGESIADKLESECIDGDCFMELRDKHWIERFGLDYTTFYLLDTILQGWKSRNINMTLHPPSEGALVGTCADLSEITDPAIVQALADIDNECTSYGAGYIYGQVVILGYKEYRVVEQNWCPFGAANQKLVLKRRRVPNGTTLVKAFSLSATKATRFLELRGKIRYSLPPDQKSTIVNKIASEGNADDIGSFSEEDSTYELHYKTDPTMDMYQLGRSLSGNDFIVTGMLHVDESGCTAGPLSRFACRIYSERLPPFRSFIYAGGFDFEKELNVSRTVIRSNVSGGLLSSIDGFTTYGVKIWQPEVRQWLELSVMGNTYVPRALTSGQNGPEVSTSLGNQLTEGTMIDLGGVTLLFQGPIHMAATLEKVNPQFTIGCLNRLKPLCPVLFNEIKFSYMDSQERQMRSLRRNAADHVVYLATSSFHIPTTDYHDVSEENRSYVFPVCGHVYGYHKSLEDRPCPLCRKAGPFVPIAFTFEPSICSRKPTHVFNPCGHVASKQTCEFWARTPVFNRSMTNPQFCRICPFCATELAGSANLAEDAVPAEAFSKLILQTETGLEWDSGTSKLASPAKEEETSPPTLDDIIFSQQQLFFKERIVDKMDLSKDDELVLYLDHMSADRLVHPRYPKFAKGYTIFGEKINN